MAKRARPAARVAPSRHTLSYQLREIIDARGLTAYATGQKAGVDPGVISRFMTGHRDIRLETADRLATALGLRLVEVANRSRAGGSGRRSRPGRPTVPIAVGAVGEDDRTDGETLDLVEGGA